MRKGTPVRLSGRLLEAIKRAAFESFGDAGVYLFGSRADDAKVGGDIDLAIDAQMSTEEFRRKKAAFFAYMIRAEYDLKIDIVQYNSDDTLLFSEIRGGGVRL